MTDQDRKERLHRLIDLALVYRGATRLQLAQRLQRDQSRLYPDTANPKMDMLVGLAQALEWPVDAVIDYILNGEGPEAAPPSNGHAGPDYTVLNEQTMAAHHRHDFSEQVDLAQRLYAAARTPDERARATRLEGAGWEGQGRYSQSRACFRRGLACPGISPTQQLALQANLAHAYYALWDLTSARGIAHLVVDHFEQNPPTARTDRVSQAFALFVRGNVLRRMLAEDSPDKQRLAMEARVDLSRAELLYTQMADEYAAPHLGGIANTCRGALLEVDVELGRRPAEAAIQDILDATDQADENAEGDWLESWGWWCDSGANLAFRRLNGREQQRTLAILAERLTTIARRLSNWALIERAMSIEVCAHRRVAEATGYPVPLTVDNDDLRLLAGSIGRFPEFRRLGWRMLEQATVIGEGKRN